MMLSVQLIRIEPTGVAGQSAFVLITQDSPLSYRLCCVTGIPARYPPAMVWNWITDHYTAQQGWDLGRELTGRELEVWLSLSQSVAALQSIDDDVAACDTDITAIAGLSTLAGAKPILTNICNRQKGSLGQRRRIVQVLVRIIRLLAPIGGEAAP